MHLEHAIPRGRRGLQEWREHRIARIVHQVHQNIDAAKRLDGALDYGLDVVLVRDIGLHRNGSPPQALNLRGRLLGSSSIDIRHHNARAFAGQTQRCGAPNPPGTAGDNRHLVGQLHNAPPCVLVLQDAPGGNAPGEGPSWMTGQRVRQAVHWC
jgi:hypothetical protein